MIVVDVLHSTVSRGMCWSCNIVAGSWVLGSTLTRILELASVKVLSGAFEAQIFLSFRQTKFILVPKSWTGLLKFHWLTNWTKYILCRGLSRIKTLWLKPQCVDEENRNSNDTFWRFICLYAIDLPQLLQLCLSFKFQDGGPFATIRASEVFCLQNN